MGLLSPWRFFTRRDDPPTYQDKSLSALLQQYETPGIPPPSARIGPNVKQQAVRSIRVWKYGEFIANKATALAGEILAHHIWGPRRKSWGIEMTLITSLMRDVGRHTSLVDISTIRIFMSLGGLVPLPSDALVTPVTFRVRARKLRGILAEYDAKETGRRELSGEWVVGKSLWQRLQVEWKAARSARSGAKRARQFRTKERVILYLHGGAYSLSSAAAQRLLSIPLSKYTDARVFAIDYRLAPETRFPGPLHDVVTTYLRIVEDLSVPPENIIIAGDSAGGGLSLALLLYLKDNAYPLPSAAILMCPWVDLTMSCDSWDRNAPYDIVPIPAPNDRLNPVSLYLGDKMERYLTHPYVSPLFGDFRGLPPLLIHAGEAEVLRDEVTLLAHKASLAGVEVRYELYEDAVHVFHTFPFLEASHRAFMSCRDFVHRFLPRVQARSPRILDGAAEAVLEDEIDNEKARVVRGDGLETTYEVQDSESDPDTETEDEVAGVTLKDTDSGNGAYASWGRMGVHQNRPSPEGSDEDDDGDEETCGFWNAPREEQSSVQSAALDPKARIRGVNATGTLSRLSQPQIRRVEPSL